MYEYDEAAAFWDNVFGKAPVTVPACSASGYAAIDSALEWLCRDSNTVLDFGCGSGTLLLLCSLYGVGRNIGIDISKQAVLSAQKRASQMKSGSFDFICGGVDELAHISSRSADGVILSNIIDNLYPADAERLIREVKRILTENGKVFVKLNPHLTRQDIEAFGAKVLFDNVLNDGLILWNNTTEQWRVFFERYFTVFGQYDIYFEEHDQYNRVFLLTNKA